MRSKLEKVNQYSSISATGNSETSSPPRKFSFDEDGNQLVVETETGVWQVEYNAENRPVTFTQGDVKIECLYDYMGRRFSKKVYEKNTATTYELISENYFAYDGYLQIANFKVENSAKNLEVTTFWDPTEPQATRPVAMEQSGAVYYYSHDYTKNVCELFSVDDQNLVTIARSYDYTPFGAVTETIVDSSIENLENNFKFSSEFYDAELALCYYNYRHYNPETGRWLSKDPVEERGGLNLYGMIGNNLINSCDYLGLIKQCKINGKKVELTFNGKTLSGAGYSATAASGKPIKVTTHTEPYTVTVPQDPYLILPGREEERERTITYSTFDYSKKRQSIKNVGPIPEGKYKFNVDDARDMWSSPYSHIIKAGAWGSHSWSLHKMAGTNTYGRGGFFIHGGSAFGSAGCIDILNKDTVLNNLLKDLCDCYVAVKVKYSVEKNTVSH